MVEVGEGRDVTIGWRAQVRWQRYPQSQAPVVCHFVVVVFFSLRLVFSFFVLCFFSPKQEPGASSIDVPVSL